jgi:hypothetical protein
VRYRNHGLPLVGDGETCGEVCKSHLDRNRKVYSFEYWWAVSYQQRGKDFAARKMRDNLYEVYRRKKWILI